MAQMTCIVNDLTHKMKGQPKTVGFTKIRQNTFGVSASDLVVLKNIKVGEL